MSVGFGPPWNPNSPSPGGLRRKTCLFGRKNHLQANFLALFENFSGEGGSRTTPLPPLRPSPPLPRPLPRHCLPPMPPQPRWPLPPMLPRQHSGRRAAARPALPLGLSSEAVRGAEGRPAAPNMALGLQPVRLTVLRIRPGPPCWPPAVASGAVLCSREV